LVELEVVAMGPGGGNHGPIALAADEHMAHFGLERCAQVHVALELGAELVAIRDDTPVMRDEHGFRGIQFQHRFEIFGIKPLNQ